jgi:hypothetical protein
LDGGGDIIYVVLKQSERSVLQVQQDIAAAEVPPLESGAEGTAVD